MSPAEGFSPRRRPTLRRQYANIIPATSTSRHPVTPPSIPPAARQRIAPEVFTMTQNTGAFEALLQDDHTYPPPSGFTAHANIADPAVYDEARRDPRRRP